MKMKVYFNNSKGNKLCGIISGVANDKNEPIIVMAHGFSSSKDRPTYIALNDLLSKKNISSFRFDFFGHGESEGKFEDITISEATDDVLQAINYLKKKGYKNIGLFGSSFGGIASIIAASKTKDLFLLVLKSPVSSYLEKERETNDKQELNEWKRKGYRYYVSGDGIKHKLNYSFFDDFENNDGYKVAPKIKVPTLIVHGDADEIVPYKQSLKTSKLIPNCQLHTVVGANHRYDNEGHREEMLQTIVDFIVKQSESL
jgi:dipeptidyl aminopeptidase/acylaminoacyl peptidase